MQIDVQEILRAMIPRGYELTRLADLAREIVTDDLKQLREVVEGLVSAGVVKKIKRGEFMAAVGIQQAVGPIRMKSKGFGFVEPIGGKPDCDIFVPRQSAGGALDGDVVLVTILPGQHRTRSGECAVGRVTAVLQRASDVVVGTLERSGNRYEVSPDMLKGPGKIRLVGSGSFSSRPCGTPACGCESGPN